MEKMSKIMQIQISVEELRKRKLFVATPAYGGQTAGMYTRSVSDLTALSAHYGIETKLFMLFNESLITRARNYCVDEFLRSDSTHLMFIDADIGFKAQDVVTMLALQSDESPYDILCGPYPKKTISWEKIKQAVDKGVADEDPNVLDKFVGDYVFNPADGTGRIAISEPAEVMEAGTGFMMIKRESIEKYVAAHPQHMYRPDHVRTASFDGSREIACAFDAVIDNKHTYIIDEMQEFLDKNPTATHQEIMEFVKDTRTSASGKKYSMRYLSEDYFFCQEARRIGQKVWLCPWISLQHVGSYIFGGSLADLASIGASATADEVALRKKLT